ARQKLWEAYVAEARATRWSGRPGRRLESLRVLGEAARLRPDPALRDEAIASLALSDMRPRQTWDAFPAGTAGVAFDHQLERYAWSDAKGNIRVRRVSDGSELASFPGQGTALWVFRFSPNDQHLAVKNEAGGFQVWDLAARREVLSDAHGVAGM